MQKFPNQKHLIIDKPVKMKLFAQYPLEDIQIASKCLTLSALRV